MRVWRSFGAECSIGGVHTDGGMSSSYVPYVLDQPSPAWLTSDNGLLADESFRRRARALLLW